MRWLNTRCFFGTTASSSHGRLFLSFLRACRGGASSALQGFSMYGGDIPPGVCAVKIGYTVPRSPPREQVGRQPRYEVEMHPRFWDRLLIGRGIIV